MCADKSTVDQMLCEVVDLIRKEGPPDFELEYQRLKAARVLFHEVLAARFTEAFNAYLAAQPQATIREKQALCRDVSGVLRDLGLAVRCPKTGRPGMLHGHPSESPKGRFQINVFSDTPEGRKRTFSSVRMPRLSLMGHAQRKEGLAKPWLERLRDEKSEPPRR